MDVIDLWRNFGGLAAVAGVSLVVPAGQRRALIGPNGAGKTTLFNCLSGALRPTRGRITVFGTDVTAKTEHARARLGVARTYQITNVFSGLTVFENVMLAVQAQAGLRWVMHEPVKKLHPARESVVAYLERVELGNRIHESVGALSYGERRQLEIALALACQPRLLLLDEPMAGLAVAERQRLTAMIAAVERSITIVLIEHDMSVVADVADEVTVLHHGQVLAQGSPAKVRADQHVREVYLGKR